MNRFSYSLLLFLLTPLLVVYLAFRAFKSADYRGRWGERFGLAHLKPSQLLVHSVSMGETLAAVPLIRQIQRAHPYTHITITTTSPTGSAEVVKAFAEDIRAGRVQHCYLPFDIAWCVNRFLRQVSPKYCVIMETELWPNLLHFAKKRGAKLMLANARLSEKSANSYQRRPQLSRPMLALLDSIAVQTEREAERFIALGVKPETISVCGSLKFDLTIPASKIVDAEALRSGWGKGDSPVWVAGSVHPGEFDLMLAAHKQLLARFPDSLLILVPRHPEQFEAAAVAIQAQHLQLVRRSQMLIHQSHELAPSTQVVLGDTMGELLTLYGAADQAFVGGTLINNGGHNPLEPAAMGLAVMMGPNRWDFAEIAQLLEDAGALTSVSNAQALAAVLIKHVEDRKLLAEAQQAGLDVVKANRGALQKQFIALETLLAS